MVSYASGQTAWMVLIEGLHIGEIHFGENVTRNICSIVLGKRVARYIFVLFLHENICSGYSFELSW